MVRLPVLLTTAPEVFVSYVIEALRQFLAYYGTETYRNGLVRFEIVIVINPTARGQLAIATSNI
jgi:hypothetical protein